MIKTPENPETTETPASKKEKTSYRGFRRLRKLITPGESLSQRVVQAGFWAFALRIVDRLFSLTRTIVLARVLSPDDFGLFGIALLALSALETFTQTGFQSALIQRKEDVRPYLDTAWTVQAIRGVALAIILFGIAPYVAIFFGEPNAAPLLRVLGLSMVFQGLTNIGVVFFQKELEFHKQFIYMFSGTLADFGVAIPAALILHNAWALIFGLLAGNLVRMIASYFVHPYRPRFRLERAKARELYTFGKWILGSSILVFLVTQGDDILVGKLLGATMLGFYQMAYRISNIPATEITHVISQVTFPAYSKLHDNISKLREAYLKTLQLTAFLSFPIAGLIFILAPDFTKIFLGEQWMPMVPAMQVLALEGLLRSIAATTGPVFQATGKPRIDTRWQLVRLAVLTASIYPLTIRWGILGTSIAVFLSILVSTVGFGFIVVKITGCGIKNFGKMVSFPLVSGIVMVAVVFTLKVAINAVNIWSFLLLSLAGVFAYLAVIYLLDNFFYYGARKLLKESFTLFRGV